MKNKALLILSLIMMSMVLIGCQQESNTIYVTSYPIQYVATRLGGEEVDIENISNGSTASRSTINKSALNRMKSDDIVFRTGQLEPYLSLYTRPIQDKGVQIVDLAANSSNYIVNEMVNTRNNSESIDQYRQDSYAWMDPIILSSMSNTILETLVEHFPQHEELFNERYQQLKEDLIKLDAAYQRLSKVSSFQMLSMTPSFSMWSQSYQLDVYPVISSRFGVLPNSQQLEIIYSQVIEKQIHYLVVEPNLPSSMVELSWQLSEELSLTRLQLHDLFSLSDADRLSNRDYLSIMYDNLEVLLVIAESS
ncbi:MAG: zinc ABC transporter solute-binding protein [Erysipelothrix sp.]|nr:zinc ABC transporter solute-binding protein [Erysipelothrix sp.]